MWTQVQPYLQQALEILRDPAAQAAIALVALLVGWLTLRQGGQGAHAMRDKRARRGQTALRIATWDDVVAWGWDGERLLRELIHIDYATMPGLTDLTEGTAAQWAPVFANHPDTWRLLVDGDKNIVGYWSFSILFHELYEKVKRGELVDSEVTIDKIHLELEGEYPAYFTMIALTERYRGVKNLRLLVESFFQALDHLADNGIFISEVAANAYSQSGVAICRTFKMKPIAENRVEGTVYAAPIRSILGHALSSSYPDLVKKYRAKGLMDPVLIQA